MIEKEKVYAYFDKYFGPCEPSTNGWYETECPVCGKRKFAIHLDYLLGKCWKGCYPRTYLMDIIKDYHQINYFQARELIDSMNPGLIRIPQGGAKLVRVDVKLPVGYTPILSGKGIMAERARNYLSDRGFDLNYMDMLGVGYCQEESDDPKENYFGYIIIPFKKKGQLAYFIGRDYIGNFARYKNPSKELFGVGKSELFFNEEALYVHKEVHVTEGWADAATIGRAGISIQGSTPSAYQTTTMIKSPVNRLILAPDAGYYKNGLSMAKLLWPYKEVKVINMNYLIDYGKDINEVGLDRYKELVENTPLATQMWIYKEMRQYA